MRQRLGQHFLKDASFLAKIADALEVSEGDRILEIGPGHGELTDAIRALFAKTGITGHSLAVLEKDPPLAEALRKKYENDTRISVIEGDVRELLGTAPFVAENAPYKIAGNIPYYLTGLLIRQISELPHLPERIVLTIQKEVAERAAARPPHMNLLAATTGLWARAELLCVIPRGAFAPPPEVDSAVIRLFPHKESLEDLPLYMHAAKTIFRQPRKTILNNISAAVTLSKTEIEEKLRAAGVDPHARPQDLSIENIKRAAILLFPRT